MKKVTNLLMFICFAVALTSCSTDNIEDHIDDVNALVIPEAKPIEIEILELINQHRISIGLNALDSHMLIKGQAFTHTDYMVDKNVVNHDNFFSRKSYLVNNANAIKVSENVAYGFSSASSVVNAWLNSEGHRSNIEGDFTDFEISAELGENNKWYFTNIFIKK
ncbi:CAP domain-containing protein [Olleya aquimaris]|uniref:Cysteine-rich secretory protein family protein n=1 Tax=Olleya aquimaris TaxID=639310 RepID=A0A327RNL8_9FLAO|nr:CAP domain-containing protein [Olleya aquimaris]RAJ17214.1 Cysteine-rich secretory protein family protein [Olleya aquimaris]